ncbi:hypothetical protein, partial [Polymorphobacter multimanifer]|uniref:hypothetical protein n=1 Tax=Polymorphobacter multimanifer TaxID=1070431 RepID=UPI001A9C97DC
MPCLLFRGAGKHRHILPCNLTASGWPLMDITMTVTTPGFHTVVHGHSKRLTLSRLLGATSFAAIVCMATANEAQAQVTVSHGNAAYTEAKAGAAGAAGKDNTQGNSCGTGPGGNGGTGPTASHGNSPLFFGSIAVVGSRGGAG